MKGKIFLNDDKKVALLDGCYDMFHYGHANALRQGHEMFDSLSAGVHTTVAIAEAKGLPVMEDEERLEMLKGCRWVDNVVLGCPYVPDIDMVYANGCNIIAHANDAVVSQNGRDCYEEAKKLNIYVEYERTFGISTTDIIGRLLLNKQAPATSNPQLESYQSVLLSKFASYLTRKTPSHIPVLIDGTFDLFHAGHVNLLKGAKTGDNFIIAAVYSDEFLRTAFGENSVLSTNARALAVMSCKYVDALIILDNFIDDELLKKYQISKIFYSEGKDVKMYKNIKADLTSEISHGFAYLSEKYIINRIYSNYNLYIERNKKVKNVTTTEDLKR